MRPRERSRSDSTSTGARGSASVAVPTWIASAPAISMRRAPSPSEIPPTPMIPAAGKARRHS